MRLQGNPRFSRARYVIVDICVGGTKMQYGASNLQRLACEPVAIYTKRETKSLEKLRSTQKMNRICILGIFIMDAITEISYVRKRIRQP